MPREQLLALPPAMAGEYLDTLARARSAGTGPATAGGYRRGAVKVVQVSGFLNPGLHAPKFGLTAYSALRRQITDAAADEDVGSILLHVASNGGSVTGLFPVLKAIREAAQVKPVHSVIEGAGLSAAYAIASSASKVFISDAASEVGSIGVVAAHADQSEADKQAGVKITFIHAGEKKVDGNPHEPLSDRARADIQRDVDGLYDMFVEHVAATRRLSPQAVRNQQAAIFRGTAAVEAGLVDGILEPERALAALGNPQMEMQTMLPEIEAAGPEGDGKVTMSELRQLAGPILAPETLLAHADELMAMDRAAIGNRILEIAAEQSEQNVITQRVVPKEAGVRPAAPGIPGQPRAAAGGATWTEQAGAALAHRIAPDAHPVDHANPYRGASVSDLARTCLGQAGYRNAGMMSGPQAITAAMSGSHTTSDFGAILENFVRRELGRGFTMVPDTLKRIATRSSASDFRRKAIIQTGDFPSLEKVAESGEYTYGTMGEQSEGYRIATYGRILSLTRAALINDDLGGFSRLVLKAGRAAREVENGEIAAILTGNPEMNDGHNLFSVEHGNMPANGSAISIESLTAARKAMRLQKSIDGAHYLDVAPRFLLVSPEDETLAESLLAQINPASADDVNVFSGKLELLVDPRISGWFLFADPAQHDGIEYSYLSGQEGLEIEDRWEFDRDAYHLKARLDFGAGPIDWRSMYFNPGA